MFSKAKGPGAGRCRISIRLVSRDLCDPRDKLRWRISCCIGAASVQPDPLFDVAWYVARHADEVAGNRDPFAHFLQAGTYSDIDPSPAFNSAAYRKRYLGRPSRQFRQLMHPDRDNPLVHHLRTEYR